MVTPPPSLERPFHAVLLDMDGTLVDSIDSVVRSWVRWCGEYGVDPERLRGFPRRHGVEPRHPVPPRGPAGGGLRADP